MNTMPESQEMYIDRKTIESLFFAVRNAVLASGGDGWGTICSPNYEKYADLFEEWEKGQLVPWFTSCL